MRVFLDGYLRVIGRKRVSQGSMVTSNVSPLKGFFEPIRTMATFRLKCKKCDIFGLYRLLRSGFF